VAKKVYGA
jgi:formyltetrahydrofolate synthetase